MERFRELMDIPKSYKMCDVTKFVLKPIDEEPSERPWEPLADPDEKRYKETGLICPDCGQALVEKMINGSSCWCHIDGYKNDATCRRIFKSVAEIKGYEGEKKKSEDKKTHEKRGFFGKLFG